ncbi:MAG TPA: type II secretion system F family protein [Candidatus Hypogeohydataceae bacterium YC41]
MELYFLLALTISLFVASVLAVISVYARGGRRSRLNLRLEEIKNPKLQQTEGLKVEKTNFFTNSLISIGRLIASKNDAKKKTIERKLHTAGIYSDKAVFIFQGIRILLPMGLLLIVLLSFPILRYHPLVLIIAGVSSILFGVFCPLLVVRLMARKRKSEIERGFPNALDLLAICAEAGVGLDTAIKRVAEDKALSNKHISREFMYYIYESQIGIPRHEALRNLAARLDIDIIRAFIGLLIQSEKLGTSVVDTLRVYSDSIRTKRRQDAEIKAARLPVLMVFPLALCIFPSLYLIILGPAMISIFRTLGAK